MNPGLREQLVATGVADTRAGFVAQLDPSEHADADRLAEAHQDLAEAGGGRTGFYAWAGLTADECAGSTSEALHYLHPARAIGLVPVGGAR